MAVDLHAHSTASDGSDPPARLVELAVKARLTALAVTDHGVGVPADQRDEVFERFHRAHGGRHVSGLGLGLYLLYGAATR